MDFDDIYIRVQQLLKAASRYYDMPFSPPKILVDLVGADAGQALPETNLLRFNADFCRQHRRHFMRHIVAHEMAHLIAPKVYGPHIRAHGAEWQSVMKRVFHLPPETNHDYDLRHSRRYRFIYGCRCPSREIPLSAIRHNRHRRGVVYLCQKCDSRLHYLYEYPLYEYQP